MESNVLLCCVWPTEECRFISNEMLGEVFSAYGNIVEIAIFCRKVMIKAFIEYDSSASVTSALEKLREVHLPSLGKLKVFKSTKFSIRKRTQNKTGENPLDGNDSFTSLVEQFDQDFVDRSKQSKNSQKQLTHPDSLRSYGHFRFMPSIASIHSLEDFISVNQDSTNRFRHISHPDVLHFTDTVSQGDVCNSHSFGTLMFTNNPEHSKQLDKDQHLKVLMVNRLNVKKVKCQYLINLFGCFGNITKVLMNKENSYALVEFETHSSAVTAIEHLKNLTFFENSLKIKLSKYSSLNFKTLEREENDKLDYLYGHSKFHRYKNGLSIKVNPPSNKLHFTSVPREVDAVILFEIIRQIHEPDQIVQLARSGLNSLMFLVEFKQIFHAIEVLAVLHNKQVNDKNLKVSFSHTKLYK
jgi:RNA recognition motif-containing protein